MVKFSKLKRKASAVAVAVVGIAVTDLAFAADPVTVDLPEVDTAKVLAWLGGIVAVSIGVAAIFFSQKNGKSMLKGG